MINLYSENLAWVYDEIYQGFINYTAEYQFYERICKTYNATNILEMGCGTGNLARSFSKEFNTYVGLDYSIPMLTIARKKFPSGLFVHADMRSFNLKQNFDAALITGRSTSYLINNLDLEDTFKSVHTVLQTNGLFVFDCINADLFMPYILQNKEVTHTSICNGKDFERDSKWIKSKSDDYHLIDWKAEYFEVKGTKRISLGKDSSIFRAFTKKEISVFLNKTGFNILEVKTRNTYAFDTIVFTCIKLE